MWADLIVLYTIATEDTSIWQREQPCLKKYVAVRNDEWQPADSNFGEMFECEMADVRHLTFDEQKYFISALITLLQINFLLFIYLNITSPKLSPN